MAEVEEIKITIGKVTLIEVGRALCVRNSDFILTIKIDNVIGVIYSGHILNLNCYFAERKLVKKWAFV